MKTFVTCTLWGLDWSTRNPNLQTIDRNRWPWIEAMKANGTRAWQGGSIMAMSTWWFVFLSSFEVLEVPRLWRFASTNLTTRMLSRCVGDCFSACIMDNTKVPAARMACHQELSESGQKKCQNQNHHHQIEDEDYEDRQHLSFSLPAHLSAKPQGPGHGVPMTCHGVGHEMPWLPTRSRMPGSS